MKKLLNYIKPYSWQLTIEFIIKFIGSIMDLFLPWLLAYIIDDIVPTQNATNIYLFGGLMILCAIIAVVFNIVANRMSTLISKNITRQYRHDLFSKVTYLSAHQVDEVSEPSIISRLTSDTYNVHQMIDRMQRLGVRAPILLLGGIIVALSLEPILTLVLVSALPILGIIVFYVSKKSVGLYSQTQIANDHLVRKVQENMTGIRVIKALSKTEYEKKSFDKANIDLVKKDQKASTLIAITNPSMNLLLNVGLTIVIIVGAFRVNIGLTKAGQIIAFLSYFAIILNALLMVTRMFTLYSKGAASANRIQEVLNKQDEMPIKSEKEIESDNHIEFSNVTFSYNKVKPNIEGLSFNLKHGESLGIIGETGSGKSTIIQLLLRLYDVDQGTIYIDGRNIKSIPNEELHKMFGVVFQNDLLLANSIYENISFGRALSKQDVEKSAKMAEADFIDKKEGAFDYKLTIKGANLSGGQKQRILIARALANSPKILILDDSSSALDYLTDSKVRVSIRENYADTTTIIIAQRVSSIMHMDKILMVKDGKAIGYGSHSELLKSCESYKEIFEAQMGDLVD